MPKRLIRTVSGSIRAALAPALASALALAMLASVFPAAQVRAQAPVQASAQPADRKPTPFTTLAAAKDAPKDAPKAQPAGQPAQDEGQGKVDPSKTTPAYPIAPAVIKQPADFNECVRVALVQSPVLVKSALEIESRRLDVQDAWGTLIPTLSVSTTYWFSQPKNSDGTTPQPYTINFSTGTWNPIVSSFDVKAKEEMTNIAVLSHLQTISGGIKRLATDFLQLTMIQEQREISRKKQSLSKMNLDFFQTRLKLGQATQLDVRIAETKLQMAKAEEEKINAMRNTIMDDVKFLLGVPFVNKLDLDLASARAEILGKFSPADVSDEKVRKNSFDLRMAEYERRLQQKNIALSYVHMLPTFGFTFQTVNTLSNQQQNSNQKTTVFYPGININMPLDYWTRGRDVARQYKKLDQQMAGTRAKEYELMVGVQKTISDYQASQADLTMSSSKSELARLQDEQTEYRHKTGQVDFDKFITDRSAYYDAEQLMLVDKLKQESALLTLKQITGDLQNQFIDVAGWEK